MAGVLGCFAGGIGGYFLAEHARTATGLLGARVLVDYAVASSLPVVVSWFSGGAFTFSFGFGRDFQSSPRHVGKARRLAVNRKQKHRHGVLFAAIVRPLRS